ncbi:MAG TPA: glycosyltransferase [Dictyobacter sp.]|nr:glycosyltransferase [Dictyobacter sp.]
MHLLVPAQRNYRVMNDARALQEAGFEVTIVDVVPDKTIPREEMVDGICIRHIIVPAWFVATRFKPWFLIKVLIMIIHCSVIMVSIKADIYHAHVEHAFLATSIAARLHRKALVFDTPELTMFGPNILRWPLLRALAILLIRFLAARCDGYITGSPLYAPELKRLYHIASVDVIRHVPPLYQITESTRLHQRLGIDKHIRIALYQGYLQADRGLERLVYVAQHLPPNIVLVLMGDGYRDTEENLRVLIQQQKVEDRVRILPAVPYEELLIWTSSASIGLTLLPPDYSISIQKCLPNKFFEYLMAGLPVLSSELDAIVAMIRAYGVGIVVTDLSPRHIAQVMIEMLDNQAALQQMRTNALQLSHQECYWERESSKLVALYTRICEKVDRGKSC